MWTKSYSLLSQTVNREQIWALFADVNNWHTWDEGIEYARMDGPFEAGTSFVLKPKGGPEVKVTLLDVDKPNRFLDVTAFPLARMYDEHRFEQTPDGLRITNTITVKGILSFLWVQLVAKKIAAALPDDMINQLKHAATR